MPINVTFNNTTYPIPISGETNWASLTNYLRDLGLFVQTINSQIAAVRVATTTPVTALSTDYAIVCKLTVPAAVTVNLPAGVTGTLYAIVDGTGDAATNNITIDPNAAETIQGASTYVINENRGGVIIQYTGTEWIVLAQILGESPVLTGITLSGLSTGVLHANGSGVVSSSNVVNADVDSAAAIAYSKLNLTGGIVNADVSSSASIAYTKLSLANSIVNADVNTAAAVAYSKLNLSNSIVNADINSSAGIVYSKLVLSGSIVNADIATGAAIVYSKLNLAGSIVNADVATGAAITYAKLDLTGGIVNADVNASAAIAYSKLNLTGGVVDADVSASAAIARSKIATGTADHVVINSGTGALSSEAQLAKVRGGSGQDNSSLTFPASGTLATTAGSEAFSNKTITSSTLQDSTVSFVDNADATKVAKFECSGITTATTRTFTFPDANTTIVGHDTAQTLTNKSIDADTNTITNIDNADIKAAAGIVYSKLTLTNSIVDADVNSSAAIARTKIASGSANHVIINDGSGVLSSEATLAKSRGGSGQDNSSLTFPASGTLATLAGTEAFSNKTITASTLQDSTVSFVDDGDATKVMKFQLSGITTATTRTLTVPDADTTIVGHDAAQVITNKDIDGGTASNTVRITVPKNATASLTALTRKEGTVLFDSTTKQFKFDDGTNLNVFVTSSTSSTLTTDTSTTATTISAGTSLLYGQLIIPSPQTWTVSGSLFAHENLTVQSGATLSVPSGGLARVV